MVVKVSGARLVLMKWYTENMSGLSLKVLAGITSWVESVPWCLLIILLYVRV